MRVAVCITVLSVTLLACPASDDYLRKRMEIISEEQEMKIGGRTVLSSGEQIVNGIIMKVALSVFARSLKWQLAGVLGAVGRETGRRDDKINNDIVSSAERKQVSLIL